MNGRHLVLGMLAVAGWAGPAAAGEPPIPRLDYFLVITGGELLEGSLADGHTPFIARTLLPLGGHCVGSLLVEDQPEDIRAALDWAGRKAPLILVTGGLGPTVNDLTREAVSAATGIALREDVHWVAELTRRFGQSPEGLRPTIRRQALVPERGGFLPNTNGTAAGLIFESQPARVVCLPGPPRELQPMVRDALVPWLQEHYGLRTRGASLTLRFVGLGQSAIDQTLREHVRLPPETVVQSMFEGARVDFVFTMPEDSPAARAALQALAGEVRGRLASNLYSEDGASLEGVVLRLLARREVRLVVAEVASKGALAAALGQAPGAAEQLAATIAAPTESGLRQFVGLPHDDGASAGDARSLEAIAAAARRLAHAGAVVVVGEPTPGGDGASTVPVVLGLPGRGLERQPLQLRGSPEAGRTQLVTEVLDRLRRALR